ncbi:daptide-type RiPP [Cryobacterium sp. Y50]|uniref:daptide-type RiPP n=1 Tax=Cryobacterium sp. Y50 TaxID=2048286 RepID=UPI0018EA8702|nr:daptide-type RiPP [Cryobacterium sp. Y50]
MIESNRGIAPLELGLQELEALEAPGFWTGFTIGLTIVGTGVASAGIYTAISAIVVT